MNDKFDFQNCWTCAFVVYDMDKRMHKCMKSGEWIKHNVHSPVDCRDWRR